LWLRSRCHEGKAFWPDAGERNRLGEIVMEWETPELGEISLACEINGYANAELSASNSKERGEK
jgi:hypothetical protein